MNYSNFFSSKIFKAFDYIARLVLINLLIVLPSFLIFILTTIFFKDFMDTPWGLLTLIPAVFYLFPSICAGFELISKYELKLTNTVFKEFFKALKKCYLKALIHSFIILILGFLLLNSFFYFYNHLSEGAINIFGFFLSLSFLLFFIVIVVHIPLVMSYMKGMMFIEDIKMALIFAFKDLFNTILSVIIIVLAVYLCMLYDTLLIICGISLPIYLIIKLTFKPYYLIYVRHK